MAQFVPERTTRAAAIMARGGLIKGSVTPSRDVEAVFAGVRARACGEDGPGDEARSEGVAELGQATEVGAGCPFVQA